MCGWEWCLYSLFGSFSDLEASQVDRHESHSPKKIDISFVQWLRFLMLKFQVWKQGDPFVEKFEVLLPCLFFSGRGVYIYIYELTACQQSMPLSSLCMQLYSLNKTSYKQHWNQANRFLKTAASSGAHTGSNKIAPFNENTCAQSFRNRGSNGFDSGCVQIGVIDSWFIISSDCFVCMVLELRTLNCMDFCLPMLFCPEGCSQIGPGHFWNTYNLVSLVSCMYKGFLKQCWSWFVSSQSQIR